MATPNTSSAGGTETVLLDVDGTLVDSTYLHVCAWAHAFARVGLSVPAHRLHAAIGMGGDRLVAHVANDATESAVGDVVRDAHRETFLSTIDQVRPTRGAEELVGELRRRGYDIAIASSADGELTDALLAVAQVDGLVSTVTTGDDVDSTKPHPELLEVARQRSGKAPLLLLGDTPWDARAAAGVDLRCVGVRTGGFSDQTLLEAGMESVFEDPQEVLEAWDRVARGVSGSAAP